MKAIKINIGLLSFLAAFFMTFAFAACDDDDSVGGFTSDTLDNLIAKAENLIENSKEGINAGDYQPGSIKKLQNVVTWVHYTVEMQKYNLKLMMQL